MMEEILQRIKNFTSSKESYLKVNRYCELRMLTKAKGTILQILKRPRSSHLIDKLTSKQGQNVPFSGTVKCMLELEYGSQRLPVHNVDKITFQSRLI